MSDEDDVHHSPKPRMRAAPKKVEPFNYTYALNDTISSAMIGITSILGTVIWIWMFTFYAQQSQSDVTMARTVPLAWFWSHMDDATMGWMAASYFTYFWAYLIVSVPEMVGWFFYIGGYPMFLSFWAPIFGTWVGLVLYIFPWLWAIIWLTSGTAKTETSNGFSNSLVLIIVGALFWLMNFLVHILLANRFVDHGRAI